MGTSRATIKKWLYGKFPGIAGSFPYYGTKIYFPKDSHIFLAACDQGVYESKSLDLVQTFLRPGAYYFDVGANIGLLSVPALVHSPDCLVISFEASPATAAYLQRTAAESRFQDRWRVVPKAVGDHAGEVVFHQAVSTAMGAFDGLADTGRAIGTSMEAIRVPMTTLDAEWQALGQPAVSIIKIDVEGAELGVLKGAARCLAQYKPCIYLEWNATNLASNRCDPAAILDFARESQYRLYDVAAMVPIDDECTLRLHMLRTENFLLAPLRPLA